MKRLVCLCLVSLTFACGPAAAQSPQGDTPPFFNFNETADATSLAEKAAVYIKEDARCDRFRDQIAKLSAGRLYDGRTAPQMTQVLVQARLAGCHQQQGRASPYASSEND